MPLPASNTPWPPKALETIRPKLAEWSAWYEGSPEALRAAYTGRGAVATLDRPSQYRGGIQGAAARTWWGKPVGDLTQQRTQLHVPIAADLCQTSADLLFAEPPTITVPDQTTQDRLSVLLDDGLHTTLAEGAEVGAALGGVFLRVNWDTQVMPDRPFLTSVHADAAWPEFRWNRLVAVTFWWVVSARDQVIVRHLERHELDENGLGLVLHGLYSGTPESLGQQVPLTEHPSTAGLAQLVSADGALTEGRTEGLCVEYVPNQRPQRRWRNDPAGAPLGRSDLDGIEPLMDALDETYSSLMRDLRLAKARLVIAQSMLDNLGPGRGAAFDLDREVFSPVNAAPGSVKDSSLGIDKVQFAIRVAEHLQIMQQLTEDILRSSGYSTQTFGESEDGGSQTATEVTARDRRSNMTRDRKIRLWRPATTAIVRKLLLIDAELFSTPNVVDGLTTAFAESAQADPEMLARTSQLLRAAEAASTKTLVAINHPEWDDEQVEAEAGAILAESGRLLPDPLGQGEQNDEVPSGATPVGTVDE